MNNDAEVDFFSPNSDNEGEQQNEEEEKKEQQSPSKKQETFPYRLNFFEGDNFKIQKGRIEGFLY